MKKLQALILSLLLLFAPGCNDSASNPPAPPPPSAGPPAFEFDRDKARTISDSIVDAMINNDRAAVRSKMEKDARSYYDEAAFNGIIDQMFGAFGSPIEAQFKKAEQGRKWGTGGYDKPMLKHWYAVRTSKHEYGSNFIFVEIVPDDGDLASSGVSIVTFPLGVPGRHALIAAKNAHSFHRMK